jgi:hypothetical protein
MEPIGIDGAWLTANHLTSGIGDYWTANVTTVATSSRVEVRPVNLSCGRFSPMPGSPGSRGTSRRVPRRSS